MRYERASPTYTRSPFIGDRTRPVPWRVRHDVAAKYTDPAFRTPLAPQITPLQFVECFGECLIFWSKQSRVGLVD
jgi:hypothetical protein